MQNISINFQVPQGGHELGDKQLRYVYQLFAGVFSADEVKTLCLLQWSEQRLSASNQQAHIFSARVKLCSRLHLSLSLNCSRLSLGSIPFRSTRTSASQIRRLWRIYRWNQFTRRLKTHLLIKKPL